MPTLRLVAAGPETGSHGGEVFACAYTPDGRHALSAAWDGHLVLWDVETSEQLHVLRASAKPLSACAVSPDGKQWASGSLDGILCFWDAATKQLKWQQMGHTRPVSAIDFAPDGETMVTASWDRTLAVWNLDKPGERKVMSGHSDLVTGCRFLPDGLQVLSWSHDGTLRLWDLASLEPRTTLYAHEDRVTAAAVSPDGRWAVSASRDETVKLWDLQEATEVSTMAVTGEVAACVFLLDGESLATVSTDGRLTLRGVPTLASGLAQRLGVGAQCAARSPSGGHLIVGGTDGRLHRVDVEGFDQSPLLVAATRTIRRTANAVQRFFGRSTVQQTYQLTCPVCRKSFELRQAAPGQGAGCPSCRRKLRLSIVTCGSES